MEGVSSSTSKPRSLAVLVINEGLVVNGTSSTATSWNGNSLMTTQEVIQVAKQRERKLLVAVICLCILCFALFAIIFVSGPLSCFITTLTVRESLSLEKCQVL